MKKSFFAFIFVGMGMLSVTYSSDGENGPIDLSSPAPGQQKQKTWETSIRFCFETYNNPDKPEDIDFEEFLKCMTRAKESYEDSLYGPLK